MGPKLKFNLYVDLIVNKVTSHLLTATIMNGSHIGQVCHIPRIDLISQEGTLPIILKRRQFPVMLAFAMTINKSQGQSMFYLGFFYLILSSVMDNYM